MDIYSYKPWKTDIEDFLLQSVRETKCNRKGTFCRLYEIDEFNHSISKAVRESINGPVNNDCSGEVGNCGCVHSELRCIIDSLNFYRSVPNNSMKYLVTGYSPCTNCANAIATATPYLNIIAVFYLIDTEHDMRGIDILKRAGIEVIKV